MTSPSLPTRCLVLLLALCSALSADELRLDDGRVLVGKVTTRGDVLEVATRDGTVAVHRDRVVAHRTEAQLRQVLADKAREVGATPFASLQLAVQARAYGLEPEMWRHLDRAVTGLADAAGAEAGGHAALQRRLGDLLGDLEAEVLPRKWRAAPTKARVHELLGSLRADTGPARSAAILELLAREPQADPDLRREARGNGGERQRIAALTALQRRELTGNDRFVQRTAVLDGSARVRAAATGLAKAHDAAGAVAYLAPGLMHGDSRVRVRTAEAFAGLGHPDAIELLVLAGPNAGRNLAAADRGVRAHVAFLNQQAYVRDFDVEIAAAAFIADPKVDVLQSGTVLDVTVQGVVEVTTIVRAYRQALRQLTQQDPGDDPRRWSAWRQGLPAADRAATTGR
ncbi:MAG: hypothetical protein KF830_04785 [Planctomycetes bacterium]|nr:hypothetical protein [Planctomycetota bacterium]